MTRLLRQQMLTCIMVIATYQVQSQILNLNGTWEYGIDRVFEGTTQVPGIETSNTHEPTSGSLWYKKSIKLPKGKWLYATLNLKSALYRPVVYINGDQVGEAIGGMMPNYFLLAHPSVKPGSEITVEIELASLSNVPDTDPAKPSHADYWRSSQASWIRDDIELILHGDWRIDQLVPFTNFKDQSVSLHWSLVNVTEGVGIPKYVKVEIVDLAGKVIITKSVKPKALKGDILLQYGDHLKPWTMTDPNIYKIVFTVEGKKLISDIKSISFAPKSFEISADKSQFLLNGHPCTLRGGSIVWNRFAREAEAKELINDREWFLKAIILPFKAHGANYLRFHLYPPPEWMQDLCDQYGLLVQLEAQYFHGMGGSNETLPIYYSKLLTAASQHPSTALIQLYNETEPELEQIMYDAYLEIKPKYPTYIVATSDTYNLHRYWWSMSENVALYANSWKDYDRPTIIDEFGANYMDGNWNISSYPRAAPGFDRFLNTNHTPEMRSRLQYWSYGRMGEYWRRIGIQGIAPFCTLGPFEDGGNWFVGPIKDAKLKPLWASLAAVYSARSVSLEIWDRNFYPNQELDVPLYVFNETGETADFKIKLNIRDVDGSSLFEKEIVKTMEAYSTSRESVNFVVPNQAGVYSIEAKLENPTPDVTVPVVSKWDIHVQKIEIPELLQNKYIGVPIEEQELIDMLKSNGLTVVKVDDERAELIVSSHITWRKIALGDTSYLEDFSQSLKQGSNVVMLDVGPKFHGEKCPDPAYLIGANGEIYPADVVDKNNQSKNTLLLASRQFSEEFENKMQNSIWSGQFPGNVNLKMKYSFEPESHFHPTPKGKALWKGLDLDQTWLWNGLRGGLNVSSIDIEIEDMDQAGFLTHWAKLGADTAKIGKQAYYAYNLEGYYGFSTKSDDLKVLQELYHKVHFVVEDLVSLQGLLDPDSDAKIIDLSKVFASLVNNTTHVEPLAIAGHGLNRTPVLQADFQNGSSLIISNLFTAGRLDPKYETSGIYGYRYDPGAVQFVLNLLAQPFVSTKDF